MRASVSQMLGLTAKRANRALATFLARHGIREGLEQRGKAQIKVCCRAQCAARQQPLCCVLAQVPSIICIV